ncbi:putative capsid protein [Dragonfly associated cyclovirus 5]|uniref:Putative capsid protein n=1 Tax=Dragonfly associated cyclovirus 5 TaxID=1234883 RepID=K0A152_9CIRC|nr:putative capsid protein [Dragonfly associated cyclovirus 5]AFS65278.1 putative capsid protein [Dragonfly associated cyclovirus 5]AFS65280.1 putative capsid protein [Dragonfly associated cyclovirus 5]
MARFKRVFRRPRRVVRRRSRMFRRRYRRTRKRTSGTMWCKLTKVATVQVKNDSTSVWSGSFYPNDFPEYVSLAPNFEAIQFVKMRMRVMPLQNVSNNSTSQTPAYAMLPWHKGGPLQKAFNTYLSVDKCKIYRQTQQGYQSYKCSVLQNAFTKSSSAISEDFSLATVTKWCPRIERPNNMEAKQPQIYTGIVVFQGENTMAGRTTAFNIIQDVWVKCINQSNFSI